MNNKHLAATFLGLLIAAMAYGTLTFRNKVKAATEERDNAQSSYDSAVFQRTSQQRSLVILENGTKGIREYLNLWWDELGKPRNAQFGEALINLRIKRGDIVSLSQNFESVDYEKGGTIPRTLQARLVFEDDYGKSINWLADLEASLPACRVSTCRISKGQSGNDIKMEVTVDLPILEEDKKKAKGRA